MNTTPTNSSIVVGLFFAVVLWGANNAATKFLVGYWPPVLVGCTRFVAAGLILLALFRWTNIFGKPHVLTRELKRQLWWRGGLNLALYIIAFNVALTMTSASHVALYLGASPIWALLWEGRPEKNWQSAQKYGAALLALSGVFVLFWPVLQTGSSQLLGELLALASSVLWTNYGRQCRALSASLSGAEISAYTFWRAGVLVAPFALFEVSTRTVPITPNLLAVQSFCILASGVVAFALWNNALRHWKTSKVYLFNNLIPLSTMTWAFLTLGEPVTKTFWFAMSLIVAGVLVGQTNWAKIFGKRWVPE